jgi:hypothetical protein
MKMKKRLLQRAFSSCTALLFSISVFAQQNIKGTLRTPTGTPLIGATVTVKGTNQTAVTDENGRFIINAPAGSTLVVSSVGFGSREIPVTGAELNEVMQATDSTLNEVVVIGYQTVRRRGSNRCCIYCEMHSRHSGSQPIR